MTAYKFATDSECGTIDAVSFEDACRKLDAMVSGSDGGSGWVEDTDGFRYETEGEDTVESVGDGFFEAAEIESLKFWAIEKQSQILSK